jgi:hypothetical protein
VTRFEVIEAARLARDPRNFLAAVDLPKPARPEPRGNWSVVKVYDDASQPDRPIRVNMTEADARRIAGDLRDGLSDADVKKCVDEGYNIVAKQKTKFRHVSNEQRRSHSHMAAQISADVRRARAGK